MDLFTLADRGADLAHQQALGEFCHSVTVARLHPALARLRAFGSLLGQKPLTVPYFHSRELAAGIRHAIETRSYDRIFIYCSAMAQYAEWVEDIPVVMDLVDVDSDKWMQYAAVTRFPLSAVYRREGRRLEAYERAISARFWRVVVSTEREAQLLRRICNTAAIHVIPNGVDTEFFDASRVPPDQSQPTIIFTGDMSYFPNEDAVTYFALQVLPLIRRSVPSARFLIVGRDPSRKVLRLQDNQGVEVTGFVQDVRSYLAKAHVAVAPFLIAAGIQNKILEALAFGLPVVATGRAAQGLSKGVAGAVDTGNSPEELAAHVVRLLSDGQLARRKGMEGRERVAAEYNWDQALDGLLQLIEAPASAGTVRAQAASPLVMRTL